MPSYRVPMTAAMIIIIIMLMAFPLTPIMRTQRC